MIAYLGAHHVVGGLLVGAVWLLWYLAQCAIWPFARCWWCRGNARKYQNKRTKKTWRNCRVCEGSGMRLRVGRRAWAYFSNARKRAKV
jgi:hypothetical protein